MDQVKLPPETGEMGEFDLPGLVRLPAGSVALDLDAETKSEDTAKGKGKGKKKGILTSRNSLDLTRIKLGVCLFILPPDDMRTFTLCATFRPPW